MRDIKPLRMKLKEPVIIEMDGHEIILNRKNLNIFCNYNWYVEIGKGQTNYLRSNCLKNGKKKTIFIHQLIIPNINPDLEIDHINGNGLDNRIENLRLVTHQINQSNQRKRKTKTSSKYFGVSWCSRDSKWQVHCTFNNKAKNIGRFNDEREAAIAYNNHLILNNIPKALNNV